MNPAAATACGCVDAQRGKRYDPTRFLDIRIGAVYNENAFIFRPEKRVTDYLQQAGGVSRTGDKGEVYLLRVDGSVISKRQAGWFIGSFDGERLMPGDTIVVPEDFERTTWTKVLKDYGQILYQFGLGAAALKVIRQ